MSCCSVCRPRSAPSAAPAAPAASPDAGLKEVRIDSKTFARGVPVPGWSLPMVDIPATTRRTPIVMRLAETQFTVAPEKAYLVNRAIQVNDASSLAQIGQYTIQFVPQYQRVAVHRLEILRGGEVLDRTEPAQVRFLERETGLESGVYSGAVTAVSQCGGTAMSSSTTTSTENSGLLKALLPAFEARHGVKVIGAAYESHEEEGEVSLMITKHCVRFSMSLCPKQAKGVTGVQGTVKAEPMTITHGHEKLTLRFDCKPCEMHVVGRLKPAVARQAAAAPVTFYKTRPVPVSGQT